MKPEQFIPVEAGNTKLYLPEHVVNQRELGSIEANPDVQEMQGQDEVFGTNGLGSIRNETTADRNAEADAIAEEKAAKDAEAKARALTEEESKDLTQLRKGLLSKDRLQHLRNVIKSAESIGHSRDEAIDQATGVLENTKGIAELIPEEGDGNYAKATDKVLKRAEALLEMSDEEFEAEFEKEDKLNAVEEEPTEVKSTQEPEVEKDDNKDKEDKEPSSNDALLPVLYEATSTDLELYEPTKQGMVQRLKDRMLKAAIVIREAGRRSVDKGREYFGDEEKGTRRKVVAGVIGAGAAIGAGVLIYKYGVDHGHNGTGREVGKATREHTGPKVPQLGPTEVAPKPSGVNLDAYTWDVAHQLKPGNETDLMNHALQNYSSEVGTVAHLIPKNGTTMIEVGNRIVSPEQMHRINQIMEELSTAA